MPDSEEKSRLASELSRRTFDAVHRLGLLLPHLAHPMDIPELVRQIYSGSIKHYVTDGNVQFLKVSLLQNMPDKGDAATASIVAYLTALQTLQDLTAAIDPADFAIKQAYELDRSMELAWQHHKTFREIARASIMEENLHERMSKRLEPHTKSTADVSRIRDLS